MAIYRGAGGSGDATNDATSQAILATQSAQAAANSEAAAANSATNAATSASNASSSATAAASSASSADSAASTAATHASSASSSAATATTKASEASTSASNVANSATSAGTSATNASNSATSAANSATSASNSASAASSSASNAATYATNAANSATSASSSETNAAASANSASNSATSASASATSAGNSASSASTSATNAASSASAAATSASNAATSATNAANSATSASTSATNAANSASSASTSETNAAASATAAAASYDSFDDRYLGAKSVAPTVDNDGNPLLVGALYFNTVTNFMKVWDGSSWLDAYASLSGALLSANNLSDLNNVATARNNLGLGTAALVDDSTLVHTSGNETIAGTKTLSSNPILSSGTANGVAYLNGSKVVTSGSGFVYNGTNVGIGDSSPAYKLTVAGTGVDHQLWVRNTGTSASDDSIILIQTGGTGNTATISGLFFGDADSSSIGQLRYNHSNDSMTFYTGSTQRLGLVSSGNVQLNTAAAQILNSSGNPILASTGSVIQQVAYTADAGSSTTSTTYVNLTASSKNFTPISTSSTLFIDVVFQGQITAGGAGVNSTGEFTLYEGGNVGSVYQLGVTSGSGTNVNTIAPCVIRYEVANTSTATRSFLLYGKKTGGTSRFYATDQRWTITEVAA